MKKQIFGILAIVAIFVAAAAAQPVPGKKFELSTGAYFWNGKYNKSSESLSVLNIPIRFGVYLLKGLEFEPEVMLTLTIEHGEHTTGAVFLGNLAYNFKVSDTLVPFVLVGGGYGNAEELFSAAFKVGQGIGIAAVDAGAGLKFLFGQTAALRIEYRFIHYSGSKTYTYYDYYWHTNYTYTQDYGRTDHKIFTGISLFF